ncbi:MAG: ATP-binding cassette domain-containing protein, partial [Methylomonas sp.]|nr:ATP-binding cassette domain-containing protein [Methylomonas sp.]
MVNFDSATREFFTPLKEIFQSHDLRRTLPTLAVVACLYNILGLVLPMVILQIMDRVVVNQSMETLILFVIGVTLSLILEETLRAANGTITHWLGARNEHNLSRFLLDKYLRVPLGRLQQEEQGHHIERILATAKVAEFYSGQALLVLLDIPFVLLFLIMIYNIGGWVALVPVLLLVLFAFLIARIGVWLHHELETGHKGADRRRNFLVEVLSGIYTIKTMAMETQMERRHERLQSGNAETGQALAYGSAMASAIGLSMSQMMVVSVIFAGALGVLWGQMTTGGLAACMLLSVRTLQPLRRGISLWTRYQGFLTARKSIQEVLSMPLINGHEKPGLPPVAQDLELKQIVLNRPDGSRVFDGLSLHIRAGECIVIQGQSGSGKSCLLNLINGNFQVDAGEILADGRALEEFSSDSIQRQIGLLPQSGSLVTGTLLENMTMFDERLNHTALEIAKSLRLDRMVANLKLGYETPIGEGNTEVIQEGLRQMVALVRELVNQPSVILFDEANSPLDLQSDKLLLEYIARQKGKVTLILMTHRPSWQKIADSTYTLQNGRLVTGLSDDKFAEPLENLAATGFERPLNKDGLAEIIALHFERSSDFSVCLPALLEAIAWQGNARELMAAMPHVQANLDISGLCITLSNLGFSAHSFATDLNRLDRRLLPCLFVAPDIPAMVITERLPDGCFRCFDPDTQTEIAFDPEGTSGQVYLFKPTEKAKDRTLREKSFFNTLLKEFKKLILLAFVLTVLNTLFALVPPLFIRAVYDRVLPTGDVDMQISLLLGVLIV